MGHRVAVCSFSRKLCERVGSTRVKNEFLKDELRNMHVLPLSAVRADMLDAS